MTGRGYLGEVLNQICQEMSELLDKQVNAQRENFRGSRMPTKKCAMKMKETNKEKTTHT